MDCTVEAVVSSTSDICCSASMRQPLNLSIPCLISPHSIVRASIFPPTEDLLSAMAARIIAGDCSPSGSGSACGAAEAPSGVSELRAAIAGSVCTAIDAGGTEVVAKMAAARVVGGERQVIWPVAFLENLRLPVMKKTVVSPLRFDALQRGRFSCRDSRWL